MIDAPVGPDVPDVVHTITIDSGGTPFMFLGLRDGDRPWQALDPTKTTLDIHDDYQVVVACGDATNGFEVNFENATVADGDSLVLQCFGFAEPPVVTASGMMLQAGTVAMGLSQSSTTPNWPFSFQVSSGAHALLAMGGGKAIVRRDLALDADTTLPDVDTSAGVAITPVTYLVKNAAKGAKLSHHVAATIGPDVMFLPSAAGAIVEPIPESLLAAGDNQHVTLAATTATGAQLARIDPADGEMPIALMPALTTVTFAPGTASWSLLPGGDVELDAITFDTATTYTHVEATASWIAGKTSLAIDAHDIPSFQPEWLADTSVDNLILAVRTVHGGVELTNEAFPARSFRSEVRDARSYRARRRSPDRSAGR